METQPTSQRAAREALGLLLKQVREEAGLGGRAVAGRLGLAQASVSRIEAGRQALALPTAQQWADACGATNERLEEILAAARAAKAAAAAAVRARPDTPFLELRQDGEAVGWSADRWVPEKGQRLAVDGPAGKRTYEVLLVTPLFRAVGDDGQLVLSSAIVDLAGA